MLLLYARQRTVRVQRARAHCSYKSSYWYCFCPCARLQYRTVHCSAQYTTTYYNFTVHVQHLVQFSIPPLHAWTLVSAFTMQVAGVSNKPTAGHVCTWPESVSARKLSSGPLRPRFFFRGSISSSPSGLETICMQSSVPLKHCSTMASAFGSLHAQHHSWPPHFSLPMSPSDSPGTMHATWSSKVTISVTSEHQQRLKNDGTALSKLCNRASSLVHNLNIAKCTSGLS